jgi:hypothetical protein
MREKRLEWITAARHMFFLEAGVGLPAHPMTHYPLRLQIRFATGRLSKPPQMMDDI